MCLVTRPDLPDRFWSKVNKTDACWLWAGQIDAYGYGTMKVDGKMRKAHRLAYAATAGPIPDGQDLDHLCRVRNCVNPQHLEPVSRVTNIMRGEGVSAERARQTHCKRGHIFDEANTYYWRTSRCCRTCRAAAAAKSS